MDVFGPEFGFHEDGDVWVDAFPCIMAERPEVEGENANSGDFVTVLFSSDCVGGTCSSR